MEIILMVPTNGDNDKKEAVIGKWEKDFRFIFRKLYIYISYSTYF